MSSPHTQQICKKFEKTLSLPVKSYHLFIYIYLCNQHILRVWNYSDQYLLNNL